jgi:predicted acyltransferase
LKGWKAWAFPLVVIGMNSIAIYVIVHLWDGFILGSISTHFGEGVFRIFGPAYQSLVSGGLLLLIYWLMLFWMYRRKIFVRI